MTEKEIIDFYKKVGLSDKAIKINLTRIKKRGLNVEAVDFCNDLYDLKKNEPVRIRKARVKYRCDICGKISEAYYQAYRSAKNKNQCHSCTQSALLKKANVDPYYKEILKKSFTEDRLEKLRQYRITRNKTVQRDFILNMSEEEKEIARNKKIETFFSRTEEERKKIGEKRTKWYHDLSDEERIKINESLSFRSGNKNNGKIKNIFYQSLFEKFFINDCLYHEAEIKRGVQIDYFDTTTNKIRKYIIDFIVNDYLVEIKSDYWWNKFLEKNLCKKNAAENFAKENGYNGYILLIENKETKLTYEAFKNKINKEV